MRDPIPDQDARPHSHGRLLDLVLITFHIACDQGDLEVAEQLLVTVNFMLRRTPPARSPERRLNIWPLVTARERQWILRHPEPRSPSRNIGA
jgi:hypothetical protein